MRFAVPVASPSLFAVACGHGLVDLGRPTRELWPYFFVVLPVGGVSSLAFFCASLLHFAGDVTPAGSAALHAALYALDALHRPAAALLMFLYMALVHVPLLVAKFMREGRWGELVIFGLGVAGVAAFRTRVVVDGTFVLTEWQQRLVAAHVAVHERAYGRWRD